jgi:hypothetical protein
MKEKLCSWANIQRREPATFSVQRLITFEHCLLESEHAVVWIGLRGGQLCPGGLPLGMRAHGVARMSRSLGQVVQKQLTLSSLPRSSCSGGESGEIGLAKY